jgi:hypothetical protein
VPKYELFINHAELCKCVITKEKIYKSAFKGIKEKASGIVDFNSMKNQFSPCILLDNCEW